MPREWWEKDVPDDLWREPEVTTPDPDGWHDGFQRQIDNIQQLRLNAEQVLTNLEAREAREHARGSATRRAMAEKYPQLRSRTNTTE